MNNLFYAPPKHIDQQSSIIEIEGQEAQHISRVLRHELEDIIFIADGAGSHFKSEITSITRNSVSAKIIEKEYRKAPEKKKVLAFGAIKKRDRLEFGIEKAVELGAWKVILFNADHSERSRINKERIKTQIISAFKQSGRFWLPELVILDSTDEVYVGFEDADFFMAHEEAEIQQRPPNLNDGVTILLVGPEGGFTVREKEVHLSKGGKLVSLGSNRLRAETAVAALLSQYLFTD